MELQVLEWQRFNTLCAGDEYMRQWIVEFNNGFAFDIPSYHFGSLAVNYTYLPRFPGFINTTYVQSK